MATSISAPALKRLLESDKLYAVVDVRDWGEFVLEQIPCVNSIPRGYLEKYLSVLVPKKEVPVVLYCDTGRRSARAAYTAEALGYTNVSILDDGLRGWKAAGYETVHGWSLRGKEYGERLQVEGYIPDLTAEELHNRLAQGEKFYVLDTRTEPEFLSSHLPGAYSLPLGQMALGVADIVQDPDRSIVTNCAGRTRSLLGAHLLRRMGFPQVYALKGGTGAWRIAGYGKELETGPGVPMPPLSATSRAAGEQFAEQLAAEEKIPFLSPRDLKARQERGDLIYLLDVRPLEEYRSGHIPGARFCSGTQAAFLPESLVGVKNATLVTTCNARARAIIVASLLKGMGYPHVCVLNGGTAAWAAQGFLLETGEPYEIDYGQPTWMVRLLQGLPADVEPKELPIVGLPEAGAQVTFISPQSLHSRLGAGGRFVLIDMRSVGDFSISHIPGARWLSRGRLDLQLEQEVPNKNVSIILYCRKGRESILAVPTLKSLGYQQVMVLQGGFDAWTQAGFPMQQGLGEQSELEDLAIAEVGLLDSGPYGSKFNEHVAKYLRDEEALGEKYRATR